VKKLTKAIAKLVKLGFAVVDAPVPMKQPVAAVITDEETEEDWEVTKLVYCVADRAFRASDMEKAGFDPVTNQIVGVLSAGGARYRFELGETAFSADALKAFFEKYEAGELEAYSSFAKQEL